MTVHNKTLTRMALDQQASNLITTTINAFNGEVTSISPLDGISLIDSWLSTLRTTGQENNPAASGLSDLKAELQSGNPDGTQIQQILEELVDQVKVTADSSETDAQTRLNALVDALRGFSQQLGGSSKMQHAQNQQAPMTSTVGGESTNSGTGASAYRTNFDDDLSNRNGGTTSIVASGGDDDAAVGMDDPTGSDGGSGGMNPSIDDPTDVGDNVSDNDSAMGMEDRTGNEGGMSPTTGNSSGLGQDVGDSESGSAYGASSGDGGRPHHHSSAGSQGDDYGAGSNTQRSGVSGGSLSGGSSDSETGSSGGRSQY